jgi:hypothetical protein
VLILDIGEIMSKNNPYNTRIEDYTGNYSGRYTGDPEKQFEPVKINPETIDNLKSQEQNVVTKTVTKVKDSTNQVIEDLTSDEGLSQTSNKKTLSVVDYAILLSSIYGIGAAVGITAGAATNITPEKDKKPILFWTMVALGGFGAYKGWRTATGYKKLKKQLMEQSKFEKRLSEYMQNRR